MDQEKLAELVKLIMADKRIMELIVNKAEENCDLTLIETKDRYDTLPLQWRENVYCQELRDGGSGFLSFDSANDKEWKKIRVYQPSLNAVAKLAVGIADETIPMLVQNRLAQGADHIELLRLCSVAEIKSEPYKKLFLGYLEKIRSYGIKVEEDGVQTGENRVQAGGDRVQTGESGCNSSGNPWTGAGNTLDWQYRALTERDLLDVEKGTVVTVGRKCIVTSLAVDQARRKSIQICREGEVK
jgi:hypothetical protein